MSEFSLEKAIIEPVKWDRWNKFGVDVFVKREDLIDSKVSGNKWRKLVYNVEQFKLSKKEAIVSFGGAFSNHLHALARVGEVMGIKTIGIVRGEAPNNLSPTLKDCKEMGMELHFVSREMYHLKEDKTYLEGLHKEFGSIYIVPEGGNNYYGLIGCQEILTRVDQKFDAVFAGLGTGNTFSGLISSGYDSEFVGISALKGNFHQNDVRTFLERHLPESDVYVDWNKIHFVQDKHRGGFAKIDQAMVDFCKGVYEATQIKLDLVYNTKVWMAFDEMLCNGKFKPGSQVLLIHTGGVQGNRGYEMKTGMPLF